MISSSLRTLRVALFGLLFSSLLVTAAAAQSLPNGGSVTGAISFAGEVDTYTFTASAGENVRLTVVDLDAGTLLPLMSLFDPSGSFVTSGAGGLVGSINVVAASSGTYSVTIQDGNSIPDETGNYEVHFVRVPGANEGGALVNGDAVPGFLTVGDLDSYTFDASAGESVRLTVVDLDASTLLPFMALYDPSGAFVTSGAGGLVGSINVVAGSSGTYTIVVKDGNSLPDEPGNYEVHFVRLPGANEGGALVNGDAVPGFLTVGDLDSYTFDVSAGESVRLTVVDLDNSPLLPFLALYDPSGAFVTSGAGGLVGSINVVAGSSGTYTVVVKDGNSLPDEPGNYEVHFVRLPGANENGSLINGGFVSEFLTVGDLDTYVFDANAGESLRLTVVDFGATSLLPFIALYDPSGSFVTSGAGGLVGSINVVAGSSGTYTVVVKDGNSLPDETGGYDVHFVRVPGANEGGTLLNGGSVAGKIDLGDLDSYTFDASAGENVRLTVVDVDQGTLLPFIALYDPSGAFVTSGAGGLVGSINVVAGSSGTYTVVVKDGNSLPDETGNYEVHFVRIPGANEGGLLLDGETKLDAIDLGDLDSYTFLASVGELATITVTDTGATTLLPFVALYGPTGQFITSGANATTAVIAFAIQADGLHTLVVKDGNSLPDETGAYSIVVDGSGASSTANVICPPQLPTDPILADVGGNPGVGPNIGNASEPFNTALDCSGASAPGIFAMVVWSEKQPFALPTQYGFFYLAGSQLLGIAGVHSQSIETWFPTPTGMVLPNDPALVGVSVTVQGFVGGTSPVGRLSSAIVQTIGS